MNDKFQSRLYRHLLISFKIYWRLCMKYNKKLLTLGLCVCIMIGSSTVANAYNGKFSFDLTSGWFSPWAYTSYVYKYSTDENPVVSATYTSNSSNEFTYDVVNSDKESRVTSMTKTGTFGLTAFSRNTTQQNYKYALRVKRENGAWNTSKSVEGLWNIDSY